MEPDLAVGAWGVWERIKAVARDEHSDVTLRHALLACGQALSGIGAAVSISPAGGELNEPILATGSTAEELEELQYTLGQGPYRDVGGVTGPVLVADLGGVVATQRWPAFAAAATRRGVRGLFVFPLRSGAAALGALSVYREQAGLPAAGELADGLDFADAVTALALHEHDATTDAEQAIDLAFTSGRAVVHQAAGMISAGSRVSIADALALLRGHAYTTGRELHEVAGDIVAGRLRLPPEDRSYRTDGSR